VFYINHSVYIASSDDIDISINHFLRRLLLVWCVGNIFCCVMLISLICVAFLRKIVSIIVINSVK